MTPHQQKLKALIDGLYKKTIDGASNWRVGGDGESASTTMSSGIVEVKRDRDDSGQDAVRITVFDTLGNVKLTFDDTDLVYRNFSGDNISYYSEMKDLLENALRAGRGEDKILNSLLKELGVEGSAEDDPPL